MVRKSGCKSVIIFGKIEKDERDEMIAKFRDGEISTIITINEDIRGIDIPEIQIVINFDVPLTEDSFGKPCGYPENYLHRICRTGRFGTKGLAITIFDKDIDK